MAVAHEMMGHVANIVARTATASATVTQPPTMTPTPERSNGGSSSPLLFFVALGFGVVFTNLW